MWGLLFLSFGMECIPLPFLKSQEWHSYKLAPNSSQPCDYFFIYFFSTLCELEPFILFNPSVSTNISFPTSQPPPQLFLFAQPIHSILSLHILLAFSLFHHDSLFLTDQLDSFSSHPRSSPIRHSHNDIECQSSTAHSVPVQNHSTRVRPPPQTTVTRPTLWRYKAHFLIGKHSRIGNTISK